MKRTEIPSRVGVPFADKGTKNTIPVDSQIGVVDGAASFTDGFPPLTMTPVVAGGIPPAGGDFNGILNAITQSVRWACAGGQYQFDSAFSTVIGGYPKGALIQNADGSVLWLNTIDDNTSNPDTGTGWIPAMRYGITAVSLAAANITLTPAQAAKETIVLSGALTANVQVIMPAWIESWLIVNNCTGSFTVSVKTTAGSGINLGTGTSSQVYGDGTNIYYGALMVRNNLAEIKAAGSNSQSAARANLALGSAAIHDVTTSPTDTTAGRVLTVGAGGLLGGPRDTTIANELFASFWRDTSIVKSGITIPYDGSPTINYFAVDGANHHAYIGRKAGANPISWVKIFSEFNKPTAADTGAVAKAGDTMTGRLIMNVDGEAIRLKPKTAGAGSYIISQDSVGANHWYVGAGSANNNDVQLVNYKAANNMVQLKADGSVLIAPTNGKNTDVIGKLKTAGEVQSTSPDSFRIAYGNYGTFWRNDGNTLYLMLTSSGDSLGPYNSLRPFAVSLATGDITINKLALVNYANFDARYIQNIQLGGERSQGTHDALATSKAPAGHVLNGIKSNYNDGNWEVDTIYFKPIQKYINGTWVTITG